MSMSEKNLAVLLTAKKFATSVAKPVGRTKPVPPQSDGTREWLAFRTECVVLKKKGV